MAKRSREHRQDIPGYDESRPTRVERKQKHRQIRHSTNQMLHIINDPDEVSSLPEPHRSGLNDTSHEAGLDARPRRYRVWKTKFWKRRDGYRQLKANLDSQWPVITPQQLEERG